MERDSIPPPIVVAPHVQNLPPVWKKRRHPAKTGMLIAVVLWPIACVVGSTVLFVMALASGRRMENGMYYVEGEFGNQLTSPMQMFLGAACCGGFGSTFLFAVAMIVLWVIWFATKD